mgnify:CR=1 FL=1
MIEIKSDKIITPNGLRSGCLYIDNGLIDGFFEKQRTDIACDCLLYTSDAADE